MTRRTAEREAIRRLRDERGMTIVEVVVAAFLLVAVVVSTFGIIDSSTRSTFRAEETQTVINIAQREIELLRDTPYANLAMTAPPPPPYGTDANDPTSRLRDGGRFCLDRVDGDDPCADPMLAPLVHNGSPLEEGGEVTDGQVAPLSQDVEVGDITVDIYRYVVWQDEGNELLPASDTLCQEKPLHFLCRTQDYKRVVVAVRAQEAAISLERPYEEVQSDFIDPDRATLDAESLGPSGPVVTGQQFWLSDTRCQADVAEPPRSAAENHATHNTLGVCALAGEQADSLLTAPPDPATPLVDYSTELEPSSASCEPPTDNCDPDDRGLQMLDQDSACTASPTGPDAPRKIHRWVSRPMPPSFEFVMTDKATLELWTRTIDEVQGASGEVCAFLFRRTVAGVDTILATDSHASSDWPSGPPWAQVRLRFDLDPLPEGERRLPPGTRLGVSIGVDPAGTPDNVLQFLYDHPEGESRLEVLTTTPLP